jgi:hypothetical protein
MIPSEHLSRQRAGKTEFPTTIAPLTRTAVRLSARILMRIGIGSAVPKIGGIEDRCVRTITGGHPTRRAFAGLATSTDDEMVKATLRA